MKKVLAFALTLCMVAALFCVGGAAAFADDFAVTGQVELVCSYSPGGGHDAMARGIQQSFADTGILTNNFVVTYKPGGSHTIGMSYVSGKEGHDDVLMMVTKAFITGPIQLGLEMSYKDFTPIVGFAREMNLLVVPGNSPYQSIEDVKNADKYLIFAGSGVGTNEELCANLMIEDGFNLEFVPYGSSGEVMTMLLGNHADIGMCSYGDIAAYLEGGEIRALACVGPERKAALPELPTMVELGYDNVNIWGCRAVYGPPGMSEEAQQWWIEKFGELFATEEWAKNYLEPQGVDPMFLTADDLQAYYASVYEEEINR